MVQDKGWRNSDVWMSCWYAKRAGLAAPRRLPRIPWRRRVSHDGGLPVCVANWTVMLELVMMDQGIAVSEEGCWLGCVAMGWMERD